MLLERFEDKGLSHYSYAVGCEGQGEVVIVDPRRDIDIYLDFAHTRNLRIVGVLETHIHADFAAGTKTLAEATGADIHVSAYDEGQLYETAFPHTPMREGDAITMGKTRIEALHTPGHTPEHLSFLVYDLARAPDVPQVLLSGDFLFVGSLGRPDLIGEDVKRELAGKLFDSVTVKLGPLPDFVEVNPAHGAGSMCGSGMSSRPMTTLGFERLANPYLRKGLTREAFIGEILGHLPPFPPYYKLMKVLNSRGAEPFDTDREIDAVRAKEFHQLIDSGHVVIDLRDQLAFGAGHIHGSFGIGSWGNLSTWAAWVVPYDTPILLVGSRNEPMEDAVRSLARVGLDDVRGYLDGGIEKWIAAGYPVTHVRQLTPAEFVEVRQDTPMHVVDVRTSDEWKGGHVSGARHIMGGKLTEYLAELPRNVPVALVCASGYRSTVAASVLERAGFQDVVNITGGMAAWGHAGLPVEN
ncbi:MAG: MBL fold metallo-hydrolase [Vicinamibacteria bacterium]|nr:MBL fold metallo-hydrolase [Vicinamibacteria bacterium]